MGSFQYYKGYEIIYYELTGTTCVQNHFGFVIKRFEGLGEVLGLQKSKSFIDTLN